MSDRPKDRELGMSRRIPRRDFLNGAAFAAGASLASPEFLLGFDSPSDPEKSPGYYPPALTGLRGSHDGSYESAHSLRDGKFFQHAGQPEDTGESYDLVIVGGGISGLAAAHFYRQTTGKNARILILDNHDDFGGHAKRNEFRPASRTVLGYGGTFSIESPAPYSPVAKALVRDLGIDVPSFSRYVDSGLYASHRLRPGVFFDKETFGVDRLVHDPTPRWESEAGKSLEAGDLWTAFLKDAPLPEAARRDLQTLCQSPKDYYPGLTSAEKKSRMARISYSNFLTQVAGCDPGVVKFLQARPHGLFGLGIDAVSAQDAWGLGLPGFDAMKLDPSPGRGMNRDAIRNDEAEKFFFHFPDGNASIARLLVRRLIPAAIPGATLDDLITARANYARLDEPSSNVRIRLNSTVVRVNHRGDPASAKDVEITYIREGKLKTVRGRNTVLACWHVVIPYICPELPAAQKQALHYAVKVPIVYTNVVLRNWTAFTKLRVNSIYAPGSFFTQANLDLPVSIGKYECSKKPEQPIVVHMMKTPNHPGLPSRAQHRAGRAELQATTFEIFERNIRDQLSRSLSAGGFDPARDIAAITVNRWPHGYAYEYNSLFDKFWLEGTETPCSVARKPFHKITIANSDADAYAYTDCAIDQAHRAIHEIVKA